MATNRVDILKEMLVQDPQNTFAQYGLAMEYANTGQLDEAVGQYEALLKADSGYVAAYYHGGQELEKLGRIEDARAMYQRGITASTAKGDLHTRSEIEAALSLLPV